MPTRAVCIQATHRGASPKARHHNHSPQASTLRISLLPPLQAGSKHRHGYMLALYWSGAMPAIRLRPAHVWSQAAPASVKPAPAPLERSAGVNKPTRILNQCSLHSGQFASYASPMSCKFCWLLLGRIGVAEVQWLSCPLSHRPATNPKY